MAKPPDIAPAPTSTQLVREAAFLIEHELTRGHVPKVPEVAAQLYVSRSTLCATFTQEAGESIGSYVRRRRLERAQELLAEGRQITRVAAAVGYKTPAAFTRAFRQQTGFSPSAWQKKNVS